MEAKTRLLHGLFLSPFLLSLLPKQQIEKGIIKGYRAQADCPSDECGSFISFGMNSTSSIRLLTRRFFP